MSIQDIQIPEDVKFKKARFLDQIIAFNPNRKRLVLKNLAKDERSHMTFTVLENGEVDMHIKNEVTEEYQSISVPLFMKFLTVAFRDFGNFIEPFDTLRGRFSKLPAILIKPPLFAVEIIKKELLMNVKEAHIFIGNVSEITDPNLVMGYVEDWKAGEVYMLFYRNGQAYRMPILSFASHVIKCLRESVEFSESEKTLMKFDDVAESELSARIVRNVKRMFHFIQPLYYRILYG